MTLKTALVKLSTVTSITIVITPTSSTSSAAGETYSLECSVTVTGLSNPPVPTITWLDSMNNTVPPEMVTTAGSRSTLTFDPLSASHAGTYTCRATVGGEIQTATQVVFIQS